MSSFNFDAPDTCLNYIDKENKMVITPNHSWNPNGDNGKGDAIGRNLSAMIAWGYEKITVDGKVMMLKDYLMEGIMDCWVLKPRKTWFGRTFIGKQYYQGYRYPSYANGTEINNGNKLSRDHLTNTILAMCYMGWSEKEIRKFTKKLKWRISDFAMTTIDLRLWYKSVSGRRVARALYNVVEYSTLAVTAWLQLGVEKFTGIGPHFEVTNDEFKPMQNSDKPKIVDTACKFLYPTFAMKITALQIRFIKSKKWQEKMFKQYRKIVPSYNWAIQLLINDPKGPTDDEVVSFKPMSGGRWGGNCNVWWNDRSLTILESTDPKGCCNHLDVDYLKVLYVKYGIN